MTIVSRKQLSKSITLRVILVISGNFGLATETTRFNELYRLRFCKLCKLQKY